MKRVLVSLSLLSLSLVGCGAVDSNGSDSTAAAFARREALDAPPPAPPKEDVPKLSEREVWVPGYYEGYAGVWVWHQGRVTAEKEGYVVVPASYPKQDGKYRVAPPRWLRADLANR